MKKMFGKNNRKMLLCIGMAVVFIATSLALGACSFPGSSSGADSAQESASAAQEKYLSSAL